jgi:hypothetical protein
MRGHSDMNGKLSKKVRKEVNAQLIRDYQEIYQVLIKENIWKRIEYAWKILTKNKKGIKFEMRHE